MVPYSNGELAQMEQAGKNAEHCVCCGEIIPEGRQVCPTCENGRSKTKPRYIDAEKLKRHMRQMPEDWNTPDERWMPEREIACYIDTCPEADVVEVVRCKNCEYCQEIDPYESWCAGFGYPARMVTPTDFCSHGKRRKDNG